MFQFNSKILCESQRDFKFCCLALCNFIQRVVGNADTCGQYGSPVGVCVTMELKKNLTEDTVV